MPDAFVITEADRNLIEEFLRQAKRKPFAPIGRGRESGHEHEDWWLAPEFYIAQSPDAGIPPLDVGSLTGTGTGSDEENDVPGSAVCRIWRRNPQTGMMLPVGITRRVYNYSTSTVPGNTWIQVARDKFGDWVAITTTGNRFWGKITARHVKDCAGGDTGTGTGTGTGLNKIADTDDDYEYTLVKQKREVDANGCNIWETDDASPLAVTGYEANKTRVAVNTVVEVVEALIPSTGQVTYVFDHASAATTETVNVGGILGGAWVQLTSDQNVPDGSDFGINWDQQVYDTDDYWSASDPAGFFVPAAGRYLFQGGFRIENPNTATGPATAYFRTSSIALIAGLTLPMQVMTLGPQIPTYFSVSCVKQATAAGQFYDARVLNKSGAALTLSSNVGTYWSITRLA